MKNLILSLLLLALAIPAFAQGAFQTEAILSKPDDGGTFSAWILATTKTHIRYKTTAISTDFIDAPILSFATVFLVEPPDYAEANDLYESRKYEEAREKFAEIKDKYRPLASLPDNFHTLAAFYEMECLRHLGNYEGLAEMLKGFIKTPLTRDHQLRQLDLYVMWEAVRVQEWDRVLLISSQRDAEALPGYQRAQVAFCKGLALDNLDRGREAVIEYSVAMTADSGASEIITQQSAMKALSVYHRDPEVQVAIQNWGTEDENKNSPGFTRLTEAAALAKLYGKFLSLSKALPTELKAFGKYGADS